MPVPSSEMEKLRLSEEDPGEKHDHGAPEQPAYEDEADREAARRAELQSVREINQVISGVVESLRRAKDNMEVLFFPRVLLVAARRTKLLPSIWADGIPHCNLGLDPPRHLDAHPRSDRTQPTTYPQPVLARRQ
jgi:hypothetical protein